MRLPSMKVLAVAVLALGSLGLVASQVLASTPTVKGKGKLFEHVHEITTASAINNDVISVPEKQTLVITDVIATNNGANANSFALRCVIEGSAVDLLPLVDVGADSHFAHSFGTGLECAEGETLRMVANSISADFKVTVVGYFRKGS